MGAPGKPVELTFQFDSVRNFSAMVLHTNNMFTKGVQVSSLNRSVMIVNLITERHLEPAHTVEHFKGDGEVYAILVM